jgi:predicted hydrocarbon binding protein
MDDTNQSELSGYKYPNNFIRIFLLALEDVMGKNGVNAILTLAGLDRLIGNYPPSNMNKEFDFAEMAALKIALEELYGARGGRGLALRAGRAVFASGLRDFGALGGAADQAFKLLPLEAKLKIGLPAVAKIFSHLSDQISNTTEESDAYIYTLERCSECWGRSEDEPVCHTAVGILQEFLKWVSGGREFKIEMLNCKACGDEIGKLKIYKTPIS